MATRTVALDISKTFGRICQVLVFFTNLRFYGILGQIFGLISSFLNNRQLRVVLDVKYLQEYPVNARASQGFILGPIISLIYINDLPSGFIKNIAVCADDSTLYSKCHQAYDL